MTVHIRWFGWSRGAYMRLRSRTVLRSVMQERGKSWQQLADDVECSKSFVGALVQGRKTDCKWELARRLEEALAVPRDFLFMPCVDRDTERLTLSYVTPVPAHGTDYAERETCITSPRAVTA